ncbi:MAG TPA: helix-turn-helix domain-containing protein [Solirubrobacterales bacterium]|nr:helix-turn-helix domain-containing protein [Solirubrobacterales bacterium]
MSGKPDRTRDRDQLYFEALAHPLRRRIVRLARSRAEEELSPVEINRRLGEDLSNLSYHVRCLVGFGFLKLAYTRRVRGATEHFYQLDPAVAEHPLVHALLGEDEPSSSAKTAPRRPDRSP